MSDMSKLKAVFNYGGAVDQQITLTGDIVSGHVRNMELGNLVARSNELNDLDEIIVPAVKAVAALIIRMQMDTSRAKDKKATIQGIEAAIRDSRLTEERYAGGVTKALDALKPKQKAAVAPFFGRG